MSDSLPERPDLDQLRRRAKELRDAARRGDAAASGAVRPPPPLGAPGRGQPGRRPAGHRPRAGLFELAQAQSRHRRRRGLPIESVPAFVAASVEGRLRRASEIFAADPGIAGRSLLAAAVLGDADAVREMLAADPAAAVAVDDERGWPPLLYACYSRWHQIDPGRAAGLAEVVRVLLDAGASPNTNDGGRTRLPIGAEGIGGGQQPRHHRGTARRRRQPRPGPAHRARPPAIATTAACGCCSPTAPGWPERGPLGAAVYHDDPGALSLLLDALEATGGEGGGRRRPRRCRTPRPTPPASRRRPPRRRRRPECRLDDGRRVGAAPGSPGRQERHRGTAACRRRRRRRHRRRPVHRRLPQRRPPRRRAAPRRPPRPARTG